MDQEALMKMLQDLMKESGQKNIKIGNFIIRQDNSPESPEEKPRQHRNNTAIVLPTQTPTTSTSIIKSQQNIEEQQENKQLPIPSPNDFVQDIFGDLNELVNLDQFIECTLPSQKQMDSVSNKSVTIQSYEQSKQKGMQRQLLPKFYSIIDQKIDDNIKDEMESALQYDFEQMLKPHISISESSHLSLDTLTTITDTASSDPLRAFLMSLFPPKQQSPTLKSGIDFLFLYAQPLIQAINGQKKIVQKLQIYKEMDGIIDVFQEEKAQLRFMALPARMDLFGEALDLNPVALHYSGHGIYMESNSQSYLLFEQNHGIAQLVSANQILLSLQKLKRPILFVFVASCHSKLIGEVFHQAGAEHVICVHTKEQIMDEACTCFARAFYHALIRGQANVCSAFKIAKNQVKVEGRFPFAEENKFLLLTNSHTSHQCSLWLVKEGQFQNMTYSPKFKHTLPGPVPNFIGRCAMMQDVIEKILQHQFITIKGVLGIGKSGLVKEVSNYLSERRIFRDGVLFIQMNQCDSFDSVTSRFSQILMPNMPLSSKVEIKQLMVTQLIQCLTNLELLIILDNCDLIMHSQERDVFSDFLELLLTNCKSHICATSRSEILTNGRIIKLEGLSLEDSAQLLLNTSSREILLPEINDFLNCNDNTRQPISKIASHPLFQILDGHPQGIILSSGLLETFTLKELFHQLNNKQIMDLPIMSRISEEEKRSLKVSLNLSWANLIERYEKAAIFFSMLGLLPCGIYNDELEWIWGSGWEKLASQLIKSSLLIQSKRQNKIHYCLYHFIVKFAETKLDQKHYRVYHLNILTLLLKKLHTFYISIGTQSGDQHQPIEEFLAIEQNIKSAIFREFEEVSDGTWEYEATQQKFKNSESDQKKKKKLIFEEDESDPFTLPLTKENLEIMQKKYETTNNSQKSLLSAKLNLTSSMISTSFKFDQQSDEPRQSSGTEKPTRTRKSLTSRPLNVTISEEAESLSNQDDKDKSQTSDELPFVESKLYKQEKQQQQQQQQQQQYQPELLESQEQNKILHSDQVYTGAIQISGETKFIKSQPNPNLKLTQEPQFKPVAKTAEVKKLKFMEEIRQEEQKIPLSKRQKIPKALQRAKSGKSKEENSNQPYKKNYEDVKREKVQKLLLYYCMILLLCRRYNECLKFINWSYQYFYQDTLFIANVLKTKACVYYMQKEESKARSAFRQAKELFIKKGCTLGVAACEAATGYIYLQERELQLAKISFENALQFYENLNHDFGKHFLNRWLSLVKNKISSLKNDRAKHIREEKMLIENLKQEFKKGMKVDNLFQKKHKGGVFILRWLGDTLSIFMEMANVEDSKQKEIINCMKMADQTHYQGRIKQKKVEKDFQEKTESNKVTSSGSSTTTLKKLKIRSKLDLGGLEKKLNEIAEEEDIQEEASQRVNTQQNEKPKIKKRQAIMPCFKNKKV